MNKKKLIQTIIFSFIGVAILALCVFWLNKSFISQNDGEIQIVLVDLEGQIVSDEKIEFEEGDTLEQLLKENYKNVVITDGMVMSIEDFTTPSDWSQFISIYVNDEMSMVGLLEIKFEDGTKISFIMTEFVPQ